MKARFTFLAAMVLIAMSIIANAQNGITVTSGVATGTAGSVSYSVGQYGYVKSSGTGGSVFSGVLVPIEVMILSGIEQQSISLNMESYPNPVKDFLTLKVVDFPDTDFSYQIFDTGGSLIEGSALHENLTRINMSGLIPAIYFLNVISGNKIIKSFKILKNQ